MAFNLSGGTITQTGTDTDLGGLAGLGGVTTVGNADYTVYDIGTNQLVIQGTCTLTPEIECIVQSDGVSSLPAVDIENGGTLNIGAIISQSGFDRRPTGLAMHLENDASSFQPNSASLRVRSGGTLNWYGGTIFADGAVAFDDGATILIDHPNCVLDAYTATGVAQDPQIRQEATALTINGFTMIGYIMTLLANTTKLEGIVAQHSFEVFGLSSFATPENVFLEVRNYVAGGGNFIEFAYNNDRWIRAINCSSGSNFISTGHNSGGSANTGLHEARIETSFTATDADNVAVAGFGIYTIDRDHGNRLAANQVGTNPDYIADREYTAIESSGSADITTDGGVLIAAHHNTVGGGRFSANDIRDKRGEADDENDLFIWRIRKAGKLFSTLAVTMKGVGGVSPAITLFDNPAYTQTDVTAQNHTGISIQVGTFNLFGKTFSIKVVGNLTTNPSLTAEDIYHYLQYHLAQVSTTFNGELGGHWHELLKPFGSGYGTEIGAYTGARTVRGVCVVDEGDSEFPGIQRMQADDETFYIPPTTVSVQVSAVNQSGVPIEEASVYLETDPGGTPVLVGDTDSGGSISTAYSGVLPQAVRGHVRGPDGEITYDDEFALGGSITANGYAATAILNEE
ncbi:MAG: hypothetical protein F6J89_17835 [Symploca sp. SIO1C4]|uniref:Uncharacterized protein n=1 Tax=Symploca sp. SIO1C4 TaxID=2607765 RepID=A0A6B3NIE8_9CYAN|nr:hypothetical protein [Symploca sp. SIO1C4]